jgi:hypothetical protein
MVKGPILHGLIPEAVREQRVPKNAGMTMYYEDLFGHFDGPSKLLWHP